MAHQNEMHFFFRERFKDQVAIVAGGSSGIGASIANRLAKEGGRVVVLDIKAGETGNGDIKFNTTDITEENQVSNVIREVIQEYGRLDILVNSAGIVGPTSCNIEDYTFEDFERVMKINLSGAYLLTKYAIPPMKKNNYGRILHITSIGGKEGNPGMIGYAASKSGLFGLIKGAGKEYATEGITVNGVAPAVIATPMNEATDPKTLQYMTDKIPMKRLGTVEEVTSLSCWIVSREASFNTGFIFDISGGRATY